MSTPTQTPQTVNELEQHLNNELLAGRVMDAFEALYAEDVVMQENSETPTAGKAANRQREYDFFASVQEFHGLKLIGWAVNGNRSYSEWEYDVTFKGAGRVKLAQTAVREWRDGKVAFERFYYSK